MNPVLVYIFSCVGGALLATVTLFAVVSSQTATPDKNPAAQAAIVYGQ